MGLAWGDKSRRNQTLGQIGRARADPDEPVFPDGEFGFKLEAVKPLVDFEQQPGMALLLRMVHKALAE